MLIYDYKPVKILKNEAGKPFFQSTLLQKCLHMAMILSCLNIVTINRW